MSNLVQTIELSDEGPTSASPELAVDSLVLVRQFLGWQLENSNFKFGLIVPESGVVTSLLGSKYNCLPRIFLSDHLLNYRNDDIAKLSRQGFSVVFSSINTDIEVSEFFKKFHFSSSSSSNSVLAESQALEAAWNKPQLLLTLEMACELGGNSFCCFAHDADPIYVLAQSK